MASEESNGDLYSAPAVNPPTVDHIKKIAEKWKFDLTDQDIKDYTDSITGMLAHYERVYQLDEPKPPVKYPRFPGYRPPPEENEYNAWFIKTVIQGATSGKLFGKTVVIKDNTCVAGVPIMHGSKLLEGYIPEFDATLVSRVLDAGGRILGKSTCENFCYSANSFTSDTGPVLNPHDKTRAAGGSSSGSAVLVATNQVDLATGGDQGGSIRVPASWCGIVGFKPTFGLIPYTGAIACELTLDHLGPLTRTVKDCALFLEVLAGPDGIDARQPLTMDVPDYSKHLKSDLTGVKVGVLKEGFEVCEDDVQILVKKATEDLKTTGAIVEEVSVPLHADGVSIWCPGFMEGTYETMIPRAGAGPSFKRFHCHSMMKHLHTAMKERPNELSFDMKLVALFGDFIRETNNYEFYGRSVNLGRTLTAAYDKAMEDYDVLVMPTLPFKAPKLPAKGTSVAGLLKETDSMVVNVAPFDATGHPALSINAGFTAPENLPVGMMIVGKKWHEQDVLNVAYAYELIRDQKK